MNAARINRALARAGRKLKRFLLVVSAACFLALILMLAAYTFGATHADQPDPSADVERVPVDGLSGDVYKFNDTETGTTCYVYENTENSGGISCVSQSSNG